MRSRTLVLWVAALSCCALASPVTAEWAINGTPVVQLPGDQVLVELVPDLNGGATVCWSECDAPGCKVSAKGITRTGADEVGWPREGVVVVPHDSVSAIPPMRALIGGSLFVGWPVSLTDTTATIKARRVDILGMFNDPIAYSAGAATPVAPSFAESEDFFTPFMGWTTDSNGATELRLLRLNPNCEPGPGWPAGGLALGGTRREFLARIVADDARGAYLLTYSFNGDQVNLFLYRADSNGVAPGWPDTGILVRRDVGQVQGGQYPMIASAGGVIVTWWENRSLGADIIADRYLPSGTRAPGWPASGLPICTESHHQTNPVMVPDGADGAIIVWLDLRGPNQEYDLYAKRVLASGAAAPGWPTDGAPLCAATGNQFLPVAAPDGAGGVIAAWIDGRFGEADVFAQRLQADGSPVWASDGIPLCTADGDQWDPRVVVDGGGDAIFAWSDARITPLSGGWDVYATRVTAEGGVGTPSVRGSVTVGPPSPNPARGSATLYLELNRAQRVTCRVLDVSGRTVRTVTDAMFPPGRTYFHWDGRDDDGRLLKQGIYFIQARAEDGEAATRIALVR